MTKEEARKYAEVMLAYANGKEIEYRKHGSDTWSKIPGTPAFEWYRSDYRVKQESAYRPFKNGEECWTEMQKHQPPGWIKNCTDFIYIANIDNTGIEFIINEDIDRLSYISTVTRFKFADGTPFGVKEEE